LPANRITLYNLATRLASTVSGAPQRPQVEQSALEAPTIIAVSGAGRDVVHPQLLQIPCNLVGRPVERLARLMEQLHSEHHQQLIAFAHTRRFSALIRLSVGRAAPHPPAAP